MESRNRITLKMNEWVFFCMEYIYTLISYFLPSTCWQNHCRSWQLHHLEVTTPSHQTNRHRFPNLSGFTHVFRLDHGSVTLLWQTDKLTNEPTDIRVHHRIREVTLPTSTKAAARWCICVKGRKVRIQNMMNGVREGVSHRNDPEKT